MTTRMLIDARHPEETRVAVVNGNRIEEFDFESAERRQLKGNIYLAKVTRVEPSLQAAFVDYGGNRHGFLAFSEIHPDYYQIPREDREALMREEAEYAAAEEAARNAPPPPEDDGEHPDGEDAEHHPPEESGGHEENATEALRRRRQSLRRHYKIQEVIKRRQVLLVQVVKEERGNKGAALTTYLSLAGRYCVLMPNTSHGGGISRKISSVADRKRLKSIMADLALPPSMGCIVRTAGLQRTKTEIKRDFDYLTRLWDEIRDGTLKSTAPALIYQDSDLIKRAIRDIYNRDIDEVLVEGEDGYRAARSFMKLLMPSHAKKVVNYADPVPLFQRWGVEAQLAAMYHPVVQLKSGGYLVINPTEALVSIDINSGRSTREHNIEETALKTNLEAAEEIARQLRLRDMAGLVVIDFIDMESNGNTRKVERTMKEALKNDRARIQVGRISSFGLMEMSRQRLRTGVLEASTHTCPTCEGTGLVRTTSSAALAALRGLEEEAVKGRSSQLVLRTGIEAAIYILNKKRDGLGQIEERYGVSIDVTPDDELHSPQFVIEGAGPPPVRSHTPIAPAAPIEDDDDDIVEEEEIYDDAEDNEAEREAEAPREDGDRRRRRRRRRRGGRRDAIEAAGTDTSDEDEASAEAEAESDLEAPSAVEATEGEQRRRRRGRRGGRRRNQNGESERGNDAGEADVEAVSEAEDSTPAPQDAPAPSDAGDPATEDAADPAERPKSRRRPRARKAATADVQPEIVQAVEVVAPTEDAEPDAPPAPKARRTRRKATPVEAPVEAESAAPADVEEPAAEPAPAEAPKPRRGRRKATAAAPAAEGASTAELAVAEAPAGEGDAEGDASASPRRGWWQRTFGA